tara:strand:- start:310 stop:537 length:228 start_codon:yes stop_codon:yes gene_type:complete
MISKFLIFLIRFYQAAISPFFPATCRFHPTCSVYGIKAIKYYGPIKGGWMALVRISKCHPWGAQGYDPIPKEQNE